MWKKIWDSILLLLEQMGVKILSDADLATILDEKAVGTELKWRVSVVDFLTLIGVPSDSTSRAELAAELGVEGSGSAEGNEALRVAVFKKLAENGGRVPAELLD